MIRPPRMGRVASAILGAVLLALVIPCPLSSASSLPDATGAVQGYITPTTGRALWNGTALAVNANGYFSVSGVAGVTYNLTGNASGYYNKTVFVTLSAGTTIWQNLTLRIGNATVAFFVRPYDSTVDLSGMFIPLDSVGQAQISRLPGVYSLTVSHTLDVTFTQQINLTPFEVLPLSITLTSLANRSKNGSNGTGIPSPLLPSGWAEAAIFGGALSIAVAATVMIVLSHRRRGVPLIGNWPAPKEPRPNSEPVRKRKVPIRGDDSRVDRDNRQRRRRW